MKSIEHRDFTLSPEDNAQLANLCGPFDGHLRQIELKLGVEIANRGFVFRISGPTEASAEAQKLIEALYEEAAETTFDSHGIHLRLNAANIEQIADRSYEAQDVAIKVKRGTVRGRGSNQSRYLHQIVSHDINFGIGPAGTGKTFLAVASAVEALNESRVQRLILVRPAVEAGEKLGFLPGDLSQKVDPYLRPLYDALYEMLGVEKVLKLLEKNVIEIAPLAYMRGRTLNDAFVILDEAQNTTIEQMKMFLTRLGFGSTAVVTGDLTQTDLPKHVKSGLRDAIDVLRDVDGVSFTFFEARDVVRHPLVARIVNPTWSDSMTRGPVRLDVAVNYALPRAGLPSAVSFRKWVAAALKGRIREADLAIRVVDSKEGQSLNRHYRGKDYATNVLSFPADVPEGLPKGVKFPLLGDLVICAPVVAREAEEQGKVLNAHYAHLTVHGVLHLLGWDHEDDKEAEAMEQLEREILAELGIDDPYAGER
uniref:PhoH-like protein n=2 Tax=cellular organisms TaxID=131567 RepID=A0AA38XPZ6_9EURO|nr:hypothetical protein H2204_013865 [Knufia peltigerae]